MDSSPTSDIFLERDTTRFVETLDLVATDVSPTDQTIRFDAQESATTLYGRISEQHPTVSLKTNEGTEIASFEHGGLDTTRLTLAEQHGPQTVRLTGETGTGTLSVAEGGTVRTILTSVRDDQNRGGGLVSVHDEDGTERVVARSTPAGDEMSSGVFEVNNADGNVTGRLVGEDATLELTGARDDSGEVVLIGGRQGDPNDVYVHITGAEPDESIVAPDNRPRIRLDGRNARLEVGRGKLGPERDAVGGRIDFLYHVSGGAETLLSMDTASGSGPRSGRVTFYRADGGSRSRGRAVTASDGLVFNNALRVDRQGQVHANDTFDQDLDPAGPKLWSELPSGSVGDTVAIELTLGDSGRHMVEIQHGSYYELRAPLEATGVSNGEPDARVWLQFHSDRAGQSSAQTLTVDGDAVVDADHQDYSETTVSGSLRAVRYDCFVEGDYGADATEILLE